MSKYSPEVRAQMIHRMLGPERISATELSKRFGIPQTTLSLWRREAVRRNAMTGLSTNRTDAAAGRSKSWTAAEKLRVVLEASALSDDDLGTLLRREGLHSAQLSEWRALAHEGATGALKTGTRTRQLPSPEEKRIRELERDLHRKDRALAEVTALLALKKKLQEIWGDEDENTNARSGR